MSTPAMKPQPSVRENPNDLRDSFFDFMRAQGSAVVPSASLLPENDPTTLFTGSGMQPMIPYLLGEKHPAERRVERAEMRAHDRHRVRERQLPPDVLRDGRPLGVQRPTGDYKRVR
jgi:hypothetical protein